MGAKFDTRMKNYEVMFNNKIIELQEKNKMTAEEALESF